jgi:hypothetical protein
MDKVKYFYSYPENIEMAGLLKDGDMVLISKASGMSYKMVHSIFNGRRRMNAKVRAVYDVLVEMNSELEGTFGRPLTKKSLQMSKPNV